jgi:FixJ family two-component response regulator
VSVVEKVLIVDDDEDLRESLDDVMLVGGARACTAVGSLDELCACAAEALDSGLAILNVNLGNGSPDGVDVCRWLRDHGYSAPIVFLTGHATSDPLAAAAMNVPHTRLLLKPAPIERLLDLLQR